MSKAINFTHRGLKLLHLLLQNVRKEYAGAELMELTGIRSGNLYPILINFEQHGLLESHWEDVDPKVVCRPRRRFYRLTVHGIEVAQNALRELALPAKALKPEWGRS
jgi:PadR family transcriptional regulator